MSEDPISQADLDKFPEQLRPVVLRHGLELMNFCMVLAGTNAAIDEVLALGERFHAARTPGKVLMVNLTTLYEEILKYKGWRLERVIECTQDIGRAQSLIPVQRVLH